MRWHYGVGSRTPIEKLANRGARAKAEVARQKIIDRMQDDPVYGVYMCAMLLGAPIVFIVMLIADFRLARRLLGNVFLPLRVLVPAMVVLSLSGLTLTIVAWGSARNFYDRTSPAELIAKLF